jgi:hypothetical protein
LHHGQHGVQQHAQAENAKNIHTYVVDKTYNIAGDFCAVLAHEGLQNAQQHGFHGVVYTQSFDNSEGESKQRNKRDDSVVDQAHRSQA